MRRFKGTQARGGWRTSPSAARRGRADSAADSQSEASDEFREENAPESAASSATQGATQSAAQGATEIAAIRLLARREHSTRELQRKLQHKGHEPAIVARVVDKLSSKKLVCDERFATSFVAHHGRRGQGPVRIRAELRQQGAADDIIETALAKADFDWVTIACEVRVRKFGAGTPRNVAERAKQARFLQYRGFSADQIRTALSGSVASVDDFECSDPPGSE